MPINLQNFENYGLGNWSTEIMNKILYSLLQQIELVKYIIQEDGADSERRYSDAGHRIIDTIMKSLNSTPPIQSVFSQNTLAGKKSSFNRTRIHSIEIHSVKEIFIMMNNFSLFFIRNSMSRQGFVLL